MTVERFGRWLAVVGLVGTVIGLFGGFIAFFADWPIAGPLLALVPIGFLMVFTGGALMVLHEDRDDSGPSAGPPP